MNFRYIHFSGYVTVDCRFPSSSMTKSYIVNASMRRTRLSLFLSLCDIFLFPGSILFWFSVAFVLVVAYNSHLLCGRHLSPGLLSILSALWALSLSLYFWDQTHLGTRGGEQCRSVIFRSRTKPKRLACQHRS